MDPEQSTLHPIFRTRAGPIYAVEVPIPLSYATAAPDVGRKPKQGRARDGSKRVRQSSTRRLFNDLRPIIQAAADESRDAPRVYVRSPDKEPEQPPNVAPAVHDEEWFWKIVNTLRWTDNSDGASHDPAIRKLRSLGEGDTMRFLCIASRLIDAISDKARQHIGNYREEHELLLHIVLRGDDYYHSAMQDFSFTLYLIEAKEHSLCRLDTMFE